VPGLAPWPPYQICFHILKLRIGSDRGLSSARVKKKKPPGSKPGGRVLAGMGVPPNNQGQSSREDPTEQRADATNRTHPARGFGGRGVSLHSRSSRSGRRGSCRVGSTARRSAVPMDESRSQRVSEDRTPRVAGVGRLRAGSRRPSRGGDDVIGRADEPRAMAPGSAARPVTGWLPLISWRISARKGPSCPV
jgi:hypothetical protein